MILVLLCSCHDRLENAGPNPVNRFSFNLIDSLGVVSMFFPERADTFFTWIQRSDCGKPCEHGDYRFQSKKNRIFKESGFFWNGEPTDSVEQLTIYHSRPDTIGTNKDSLVFVHQDWWREKVIRDPQTANLLSDTILKIGDRHYCVFQTAGMDPGTGVRDRRLIAFTMISRWAVEFHYKLLTKRYSDTLTGFFKRSLDNLKTVRITDGSGNL